MLNETPSSSLFARNSAPSSLAMSIESLPEAVRSSVRSGVHLFDFARVVEELVFNSLDAHASMVSVYVGVGTCYVKVVDDGSGITRDGLELLGQRYATSKFNHLVDSDAETGTFGFRGEALASISDFSLLDIVTKACGRPNGYRKVMKRNKCLCLGICDDMKDVGTTVVVRDLFYNQPVRRKYIQSSPKKVLQSVKKCVLRIALVHSEVSFKVVDVESEDILFSTHASSPTLLLASCFGVNVSTSFHQLNISDEKVKLSGYISGPCDNLTTKAFQYVYINSRFVSKGPIHKLVNHLSAQFECYDQVKAVKGAQNRKRSRPQTCPAFILNIACHRSFYDLTFEPSKTYVEFKDWVTVLALLEEAIRHLWTENTPYSDITEIDQTPGGAENSLSAEGSSIIGKRNCTILSHQSLLDAICSDSDILSEEVNHWSDSKQDITQPQHSHKYPVYFDEQENELNFISQTNQIGDFSFSKSMHEESRNCKNEMYISDNKCFTLKDDPFVNKDVCKEIYRDSANCNNFSSCWRNDSLESNFQRSSDEIAMFMDVKKPVLRCCSGQGILAQESTRFTDGACGYHSDSFKMSEILTGSYDKFGIPDIDSQKQSCDFSSRSLWQDPVSSFKPLPTVTQKSPSLAVFDTHPGAFGKSTPICEERRNNGLSSDLVMKVDTIGSDHIELDSEWCSLTSDSFSHAVPSDVELLQDINRLGDRNRSIKTSYSKHFMDREEYCFRYGYNILGKRSIRENSTTSYSNNGLDDHGSGHSHGRYYPNKNCFPECTDLLSDETEWLSFDLHCKSQKGSAMYKRRSGISKQERKSTFLIAKGRSRSHSAPPFSRSKRSFFSLNSHLAEQDNDLVCPEALEHVKSSPSPLLDARRDLKHTQELKEPEKFTGKDERFTQSVSQTQDTALLKVSETTSIEVQDSPSWSKWRNCCSQTSNVNKLHDIHDQNTILDISSGFLHLAGDSLVPESITKTCLEDAIVLHQVDKKFIPVVAGRTLAVVDQHAADERIRLEELRRKVLSGEGKKITLLEAERELRVPELGYQLLHNYAQEIKEWGWICDIHAQDSRSFKRNLNLLHRQPTIISLTAVPCILGVNLTDLDLMEFLEQLADTDGSSTMPPSVLRILNSKACRGAIMFGDSLLPSECSLLISELKQTSLCFQCAHGRPTTAPLVNLEALHKQIAKLELVNGDSTGLWHGLGQRQVNFERAELRLRLATS